MRRNPPYYCFNASGDLLNRAQAWWLTRFLRGDRSPEILSWARGDDGGYPNLATVTWPG